MKMNFLKVYLRCWRNSSIFFNKIPQELSIAVARGDLSSTEWESKNEGSGTDHIPATVAQATNWTTTVTLQVRKEMIHN